MVIQTGSIIIKSLVFLSLNSLSQKFKSWIYHVTVAGNLQNTTYPQRRPCVSVSVTSANSLTCAGVLCGRSGLSYWEVDQQNQQDARQQQLEAAQRRHGVLTRQLAGKSGQENKLQTGTEITLVHCSKHFLNFSMTRFNSFKMKWRRRSSCFFSSKKKI